MSMKKLPILALCLGLQLPLALPSQATVESEISNTFKSAEGLTDTAVSADGQLFFTLSSQGQVDIYETNGTLKDSIKLASPANKIASSPSGEQLFLTNTSTGTTTILSVNFIQKIDTTGAPFKGPENAPVTVAIFSDFQCPYCARISPLLDQLLALYPKDVKVVYKNFPLRSHQFSLPASIAARAAHRQGKFWEMYDKIFENYSTLNDEKLTEFAKNIGLNMEQFTKDSNDPKLQQEIQADLQNGIKAEVRGTPTIFVNGRRLTVGGLDGLKALVEAQRKKI
ncbi:MAG: thioredoxin domain-containing protein [Desulfobulbaceae bacterium]|nr:thioredoxin domain-containing protein [Desulfobulbaceae bacterium]